MVTAAGSDTPGELCDCDWINHEHPEIGPCGSVACGCDRDHVLERFKTDAVHWEGRHWSVWCAFREALRRLSQVNPGGSV